MRRTTAILTCALALPAASLAQVPAGPEFRVNAYTTGIQTTPRTAADAAGNFVVTWHDSVQDGGSYGAFARRYDAGGTAVDAAEFRLNAYTDGVQAWPTVAAASDGRLSFAWQTDGQDESGFGIFGRRFDAGGAAAGGEFPVNTFTTGSQSVPSVAADAAGGFVVVWSSGGQDGNGAGMFGQRFDADGAAQGAEFAVNTYTTGHQRAFGRSVAAAADGGFVVVWDDDGLDGSLRGVFARRFDAAGAPAGVEFRVNDYVTGEQFNASVAVDATGSFVVVWTSQGQPGGSGADVVARRYDASGAAVGPEFIVNAQTAGFQVYPSVALGRGGEFVVVWQGPGAGDSYDVMGRLLDDAGPVAGDFALATITTGYQLRPSIASAASGDFVVAWMSPDGPASNGIFARRFRSDLIFADGFDRGTLAAWSASAEDGGDLTVQAAAALDATTKGLHGFVDDVAALYAQDDTPEDEPRYRARFWIDPNGFDPGVAQGHLRTRVFIAFTEGPSRRVAAIVLRLQSGVYGLQGRARLDDGTQADTGFFAVSDGPYAVELDLRPAGGPDALDGTFELFIDGESKSLLTGLDNSLAATDFVRLGALSVKAGASGTLYWDEFESRRQTPIGP